MRGEELVNQIPFRTHDFNAIVARALSQLGAGDEIADLLLDTVFVQLFGSKRVNGRLNGAGGDLPRAVSVTPGVKDLQAYLAAGIVYRASHDHVFFGFFYRAQLGRAAVNTALVIRCNATRDHQANAAFGTLGKVGRHALKATGLFFQPSVHRAHQGTVAQGGKTQIQRGHQVRVMLGIHQVAPQQVIHGTRETLWPPSLNIRHIKDLRRHPQCPKMTNE